ncbi:hypothetical protein [Kineococcus sp. NPDC059986]|uniref:hypothetical protein n=1 Tax=Kineococcus sp. NPDC059986 TaxID=3155538 RepID=UPI00344E259E
MTTARPAVPREVAVSRGAAVAGAVAAVLHVPLAVAHAGSSLVLAAGLLVMSLACLPCAGHLWRSPSPRTWTVVAAVGTAVLLVHAALLAGPAGPSAPGAAPGGHAGHATALALPGLHGTAVGDVGLVLVSVLTLAQVLSCLVLLSLVLLRRTGRRPLPVQSTVR